MQPEPSETDDSGRDLLESRYDLICTHDMDGNLLSVNPAAEKALGYPHNALVGRNLRELLVPEVRHLFPAYLAEIAAAGSAGGVMRMRAANGEIREWEYHNTERRADDGRRLVLGIAHDVTEQLRAVRALRASEQRFRALFEQAAVGVVQIDTPAGRIRGVNRKCAEILGYSQTELLALEFSHVLHPQDRQAELKLMAQLERGEIREFSVERRLLRRDGSAVWVALSVSPMWRPGGRPVQHMVVVQDITERKQAEAQRAALEAQLRQAQKLEAIGTLAGGIAHDFNNILGVMVGNLDLARLDLDPQHPAMASLDAATLAAGRASELVRQILTFSRKQAPKRTPMRLGPVIEEAARLLRATIPASIRLELHLDASAPPVLADATQIQQIVMNLCTNAWHAIEPGAGRIRLSLEAVTLADTSATERGRSAGSHARISVRDDGKGIDSATLERIFEPFFTTREVGQGAGLGLSVVHGIVEEHGGTITVDSRPGAGSTFYVLLPAAVAPVSAEGAGSAAGQGESAVSRTRRGRVLYIDDEPALADSVARLLEKLGYEATICLNGSEALELIRCNPGRFDVVVTDFNMPGLSGTDVAREVAKIRADLPVVLASGYTDQSDERLTALGIRYRLDKPFGCARLTDILNRVIAAPA